ncbi:DUF3369 domain-containing protein [Azospirillum sp. INR13]|uniref:DUF3369 domain-containing protein n=1 Tax=Azospirillum sp. INR13 TaxID=2596919 RepID=UPI00351C81E9
MNEPAAGHVDASVLAAVTACLEERAHLYAGDHCTLYIRTPNDRETVVYLRSNRPLSDLDRKLIEVFCGKISVGFDNLHHYEQLYRAQQGTLAALADLAERGRGALGMDGLAADGLAAEAMEDGRFSRSLRIAAITERIARRLHADGLFPEALDDSTLEIVRGWRRFCTTSATPRSIRRSCRSPALSTRRNATPCRPTRWPAPPC